MDDSKAKHKEKIETGRDSGAYTDRQNMYNEGARPKEKGDTNRDSNKYRDRQNIDNKGGSSPNDKSDTLDTMLGICRLGDGQNMDNSLPKEKTEAGRDSDRYRDIQNIDNKGVRRPNDKSDSIDTMIDSGKFRDGQNIDNKGARPKEKRDNMRVSRGFRDGQNIDNKAASKPKEKCDTMRDSGGFRERQNIDNNEARHQEKCDTMRDSDRYRDRQSMDSQLSSGSDSNQFVRHLSVRLCYILDEVGASAEFRKLRQDCAISQEIMLTLREPLGALASSHFMFGSSSEGTTIQGLNSDTDVLLCRDYMSVVDNISDASDGFSYLIIREKHTEPGYVKLQLVNNGQPQTVDTLKMDHGEQEAADGASRICLKHLSLRGGEMDSLLDQRNGPADTNTKANYDYVTSLRYSRIPEFSSEWIVRKRPYRWPPKRMLDKMGTMGCFLVGVGHPSSKERNIEWRVSFSLQERELMLSMNIVQHKCYILLKVIKKDLIEPAIGKSVSSYHLKTCMFHVVENTKKTLWKRSNLVQCVIMCLQVLLEWVRTGYCPNYFIKEENMFDREVHRTQRKNLEQHLKHLLSNGCEFIFQITLDCIGDFLKRVTKTVQMEFSFCETYFQIKKITINQAILYKAHICYALNDRQTPIEALEYLHTYNEYLPQTNCIKDHTEQQTQEAFSYITPIIHLHLAQSYASLAFSTDVEVFKYLHLQSCKHHLDQGDHIDMTSSRLLWMTVLYKQENYEQCISILHALEQKLNCNTLRLCQCEPGLRDFMYHDNVKECYDLTVASILCRTSTCVVFRRSDTAIIPEALQYEIYRSVGAPQTSRHWYCDRWMNLAVVNAVIYVHFMKYRVYAICNQFTNKDLAIKTLESILKSDSYYLTHRETGYNILGWIYFQEGRIREGIKCFKTSWSKRPDHNAAKFHIMFYLFGDRNYQM